MKMIRFAFVALFLNIAVVASREPEYPHGTCGVQFGSRSCDSSRCCGRHGFCGTGVEYCGSGCQRGYGKLCDDPPVVGSGLYTADAQPVVTNLPLPSYGSALNIARFLEKSFFSIGIPGIVPAGTVVSKCQQPNQVALTFDDGPNSVTADILEILKKKNIKVTFFMIGITIESNLNRTDPNNTLRKAFKDGHQIAGHSYSHKSFLTLDENSIQDEIIKTNEIIKSQIGVAPRYVRLPFGDGNFNQTVIGIARNMGMVLSHWNFDSYDFQDGDILKRYQQFVEQKPAPQSIVALNHDIHERARDSLEKVVDFLNDSGFKFVTMAECAGDHHGAYTFL